MLWGRVLCAPAIPNCTNSGTVGCSLQPRVFLYVLSRPAFLLILIHPSNLDLENSVSPDLHIWIRWPSFVLAFKKLGTVIVRVCPTLWAVRPYCLAQAWHTCRRRSVNACEPMNGWGRHDILFFRGLVDLCRRHPPITQQMFLCVCSGQEQCWAPTVHLWTECLCPEATSGPLGLVVTDRVGSSVVRKALSSAPKGVQQHPWPLPTRCQ